MEKCFCPRTLYQVLTERRQEKVQVWLRLEFRMFYQVSVGKRGWSFLKVTHRSMVALQMLGTVHLP